MNDTLLTTGEMWGASFVKRLKVMKKAVYHSFLPVFFVEFSLNLSASAYLSPSIRSPRFSVIFPIVEFYLFVFFFFLFCGVLVGGGVFERIRDERGLNRNIAREN